MPPDDKKPQSSQQPASAALPLGTTPSRLQIVKYAPPPPDLPMLGKVDPAEINFFGRTNYVAALEEKKFIFGIKREDRRRHMYIVGKTGTGKSKLLELLIRQDIQSNKGLCVIDPHGQLIEAVLAAIPENRKNDVCIIDPSDHDFLPSFNPLAHIDPSLRHRLAQGFIEVISDQFGIHWTPRVEHVFRFAVLALLDYPHATMRGMISMLTDETYRRSVVEYIDDELVRNFWSQEFPGWAQRFESEAIIPLVNKLSQFLSDPILRTILDQKESKIDFEKLMKEKKIVLIKLAKGVLGQKNASLLGALFLLKIKHAGIARARLSEREREDFYLYIDEFQFVATEMAERLISEAREYGLCLTITHQYMAQLSHKLLSVIFGNTATIITFRVGGPDATILENEFVPVFKVKDMINLGKQEFYIRLLIQGEHYDPFSAQTLKVMAPNHPSFKDRIIEASRRQYASAAAELKKAAVEKAAAPKKHQLQAPVMDNPTPLI